MKARVEGIRAMILKLAMHHDRGLALAGSDDQKAAYHHGQVELLTPLVKAYASDQAFQICANALQVMGGAGYTSDHPIEQYLRDSKVFSIYEGTNHIQAMDLVGRKLGQSGGAHLMQFGADVGAFVDQHREHEVLGEAVKTLGAAQEAIAGTAMTFMGWSQDESKLELIPSVANRFLEMMSELTVGWLLLDQAVIAIDAMAKLSADHPDRHFYAGKKYTALHFARNVLAAESFATT
jgi:alkylation response protein AidB-like acyl-CoA dehydrogenase